MKSLIIVANPIVVWGYVSIGRSIAKKIPYIIVKHIDLGVIVAGEDINVIAKVANQKEQESGEIYDQTTFH